MFDLCMARSAVAPQADTARDPVAVNARSEAQRLDGGVAVQWKRVTVRIIPRSDEGAGVSSYSRFFLLNLFPASAVRQPVQSFPHERKQSVVSMSFSFVLLVSFTTVSEKRA